MYRGPDTELRAVTAELHTILRAAMECKSKSWHDFSDKVAQAIGRLSRTNEPFQWFSRAEHLPPEASPSKPTIPAAPAGQSSQPAISDPAVNQRIGEGLAARHGIEVFGFEAPGLDTHTVGEIALAVDDMLTKYPNAKTELVSVGIHRLRSEFGLTERLWTTTDGSNRVGSRISFSAEGAKNPTALSKSVTDLVQGGYFNSGSERRPAYTTIVHEFGHVLANAGGEKALDKADGALRDHFMRRYGSEKSVEVDLENSFKEWRAQLSGYSFWDEDLYEAEALSEAFTDVEINRDRASEPAQVLHKLLVDTAESEWRKQGLI
ncbi:hypothetical protein [Nocardia brevicatena]|uniref:hypothetical protein n=1 Tax=Nocardia brevicatena TaxID=37327 RepID=UPI0002E5BA17|nr:hypothetical protein [Nocardia brevicatena]